MCTYKSHGFIWPDCKSQASAVHDPCRAHSRKQDQTYSTEPRQDHAHFGHPVAVVLPVGDGVDDLEVALQSDYNQPELAGGHSKGRQCKTFEQHANHTIENRIAVVVIAVGKHHDNRAHSKHGRKEIHGALVGDESMDTAPELTTCTN